MNDPTTPPEDAPEPGVIDGDVEEAGAEPTAASPPPWRPMQAALFAALIAVALLAAGEIGPVPGWACAALFGIALAAWAWLGRRVEALPGLERADQDPFAGAGRWIILAAWFVVRAPLILQGGYSSDLDAWRVAVVARRVFDQGAYEPSRWPGYPVVEIGLAPFIKLGGPILANLATAVVGLVGLFLFDRLGRALGLRAMGLATWALCLSAPVVVNTASTVDYPWALTALLGALLAGTQRRWALAGALLGVATGCRLPTGTYGLPLLLLALKDADARRATRDLCLATAISALVVLSPLWIQYGLGFLRAYGVSATLTGGSIRVVWGLGLLTVLASAAVVVDAARGWGPPPQAVVIDRRSADHVVLTLFWMVIGWYVLLPVQGGYLYPLVPFGLYVAARWARPAAMAALGLAMAVANVWDIRPGFIPEELEGRDRDSEVARVVDRLELPEGATLIVGGGYAVVRGVHPEWEVSPADFWRDEAITDPERGLTVVLDLKERALQDLLNEGAEVWLYDDSVVEDWTKRHKADPVALGAQVLSAEQRGEGKAARKRDRDEEARPRGKKNKDRGAKEGKGPGAAGDEAEAADDAAPDGGIWVSSDPEATKLKHVDGRVLIDLNRKDRDDGVVEVCQGSPSPASGARRAQTRWRIKKLEPSGTVEFVAVWLAKGREIGRQTLGSASAVSPDTDLSATLEPPSGAESVQACVRLSAPRAIVAVGRVRLSAGGQE